MRTVVIPCAGTGSRLGSLTKNYNKALCTLGPKPIISYIIEKFTENDEIFILLGYKGDFVKQAVKACYPNWNITFIDVDIYEGEGSGLGYSLSKAYSVLQKPFIFWSNDTVIDFDPDSADYDNNWIVYSDMNKDLISSYRHVKLSNNIKILPKVDRLPEGIYRPYVGVSFIKDYNKFWQTWLSNKEAFINTGEVFGLNNLSSIRAYYTRNWIDTGNKEILQDAQAEYSAIMEETVLPKPDEAIWFIDDKVIKFHIDKKFIQDRVNRFNTFLSQKQQQNGISIPRLLYYSDNIYVYKRAEGTICSKIINPTIFDRLLNSFFCQDYLDLTSEQKYEIYKDFYLDKTLKRINKFCTEANELDNEVIINGLNCKSAGEIVKNLPWHDLADKGIFSRNYHGDFHLENILYNNGNFIMLDWRQNFGKSEIGDLYYDLAKMAHSLIVNHLLVKDNLFTVQDVGPNEIHIDIHRTFMDTECEKVLKKFIESNPNFDLYQVKLLTAIVFLNIAACHIYPYSRFLFYLGKYLINQLV